MNMSTQYLDYALKLFELRDRLKSEVAYVKDKLLANKCPKDECREIIEKLELKIQEITNDIYIRLDLVKQ